jgi:L,D-transpeptidase YbiS
MPPERSAAPAADRPLPGPAPARGAALRAAVLGLRILLLAAAVGALAFAGLVGAGVWIARSAAGPLPAVVEDAATLREQGLAARRKIEKVMPHGQFIVVDTAKNRLYLRDGDRVVREVVVSCGSGAVLPDPSGKKTWVFDTPRGERMVKSKAKHPTWIKPDWAFYEEGETPPKKYEDRVEEGVLGDYALGIGDGFFLHGTLYTRLLGRNVTHGCVRIGDADLEYLYKNVPLGTKVYIF